MTQCCVWLHFLTFRAYFKIKISRPKNHSKILRSYRLFPVTCVCVGDCFRIGRLSSGAKRDTRWIIQLVRHNYSHLTWWATILLCHSLSLALHINKRKKAGSASLLHASSPYLLQLPISQPRRFCATDSFFCAVIFRMSTNNNKDDYSMDEDLIAYHEHHQ